MNQSLLIIAKRQGQLGNRLFHFAHHLTFAIANQVGLINPCFTDYAEYFEGTHKSLLCHLQPFPDYLNSTLPGYFLSLFKNLMLKQAEQDPLCLGMPAEEFKNLAPAQLNALTSMQMRNNLHRFTLTLASMIENKHFANTNLFCVVREDHLNHKTLFDHPVFLDSLKLPQIILLDGWQFRDKVNFNNYLPEIKRYFSPIEPFRSNIFHFSQMLRSKGKLVVGLHMRRGDYRDFEKGKYFYEVADYALFLRELDKLLVGQDPVYLICSDEKFDHELFSGLNYQIARGHLIEDMYCLANSDLIIGPPSTFSGWAKFYGNIPLFEIEDKLFLKDLSWIKSKLENS